MYRFDRFLCLVWGLLSAFGGLRRWSPDYSLLGFGAGRGSSVDRRLLLDKQRFPASSSLWSRGLFQETLDGSWTLVWSWNLKVPWRSTGISEGAEVEERKILCGFWCGDFEEVTIERPLDGRVSRRREHARAPRNNSEGWWWNCCLDRKVNVVCGQPECRPDIDAWAGFQGVS